MTRWLAAILLLLAVQLAGCDTQHTDETGSVRGTTRIAQTEAPLAGVVVSMAGKSTTSDLEGRYTLESVPIGIQLLHAQAEGFALVEARLLVGRGVTRYDARLGDERGALSGRVTDDGGLPLAGASIELLSDTDTFEATSDDDGFFAVSQVPVGGYRLTVGVGGYDRIERQVDVAAGGTSLEVPLALAWNMVRMEPGVFDMGSRNGRWWEQPVHEVTLTRPFAIGRTEFTNGDVRRLAAWRWAVSGSDERPVVDISWENVMLFLADLSVSEGLEPCFVDGRWSAGYLDCTGYRLPTEAEWEYAARAGTTTEYFFGDSMDQLGEHAWIPDNSGTPPVVQPVAGKLPNPWGLFDVHGNAAEWAADIYAGDSYPFLPAVDPYVTSPFLLRHRAVRGGGISWEIERWIFRSASRQHARPGDTDPGIGFRIVRTLRP